jgi:hypothetical protein
MSRFLARILLQLGHARNSFSRQEGHLKPMANARYSMRTTHTKTTSEITVEREEFTALRALRTQRGWCGQCSRNTSLVTPEEAAAALSVSVNMILAWCRTGELHFANDGHCPPFVCFRAPCDFP